MAKLTTNERKALPKSEFGEPGKRAYPMPDKAHARNAKARASEMERKGKLSESAKSKIDKKADQVLGKSKSESIGKYEKSVVRGMSQDRPKSPAHGVGARKPTAESERSAVKAAGAVSRKAKR